MYWALIVGMMITSDTMHYKYMYNSTMSLFLSHLFNAILIFSGYTNITNSEEIYTTAGQLCCGLDMIIAIQSTAEFASKTWWSNTSFLRGEQL